MNLEALAKDLADKVKAMLAERDATIADLSARLKSIEDRPPPKDGIDGEKGEKGDPGDNVAALEGLNEVRLAIKAIEDRPLPRDGRDGVQGVKGDPGERGSDGRNGNDGWSPDHVQFDMDDDGQWEFKMVTGDKEKSWAGRAPVFVDRGVFSAEASYLKGHFVSYGGDGWVCKQDNPGPPGKDFSGWRLAVRKGRDAPRAKV